MEQLRASIEVTSQLADATNGRTMPLLPADLQTTNAVLDQVINILEGSADTMAESDAEPDDVCKLCSLLLETEHYPHHNLLTFSVLVHCCMMT